MRLTYLPARQGRCPPGLRGKGPSTSSSPPYGFAHANPACTARSAQILFHPDTLTSLPDSLSVWPTLTSLPVTLSAQPLTLFRSAFHPVTHSPPAELLRPASLPASRYRLASLTASCYRLASLSASRNLQPSQPSCLTLPGPCHMSPSTWGSVAGYPGLHPPPGTAWWALGGGGAAEG